MIVWRPGVAKIDAFHRCSQQIYIVIFEINSNPWLSSRVYASIDYKELRKLWYKVSNLEQ